MSFKRDTLDMSLLRNLKFRRVSEILAQQIPEDEARLLSNGRLTCLVCLHRPIFDNMNMLSTHRKGRRHLAELSKYLQHKRELQLKMLKSSQLQELRATSRNPKISLNEGVDVVTEEESSASFIYTNQRCHPLLSSSPYSSCSKKRKQKIPLTMQRKMVLETPKLTPLSSALVIDNSEALKCPSAHSEVRRYLKGLQRKRPFGKLVEKLKEEYSLPQSQPGPSSGAEIREDTCKSKSQPKVNVPKTVCQQDEKQALNTEKMEHNVKLMMSGWIWKTDGDGGKWEKDPDAEFDSDEEEPPAMN